MEQDYRLAEGEYRFACLVWANEPLGSGQLVALANEALGWKKSTTYTVLKKLCERGILHNANGTVTALVKQAQVQQEESEVDDVSKLPDCRHDDTLVPTFLHTLWLMATSKL